MNNLSECQKTTARGIRAALYAKAYDLSTMLAVLAAVEAELKADAAEDAAELANDVVILYATCPDCGAQEEIGRAVNPEPEDLDQLTYGEPVKQLCTTCFRKRSVSEVLVLLASRGCSLEAAAELLYEAKSRVADIIQAPAMERAQKALSEFISENDQKPEAF